MAGSTSRSSGRKASSSSRRKASSSSGRRKQVVVYKPKKVSKSKRILHGGPKLVKVYEPNADGTSYTKKWVTKEEARRIEQQNSLFDNAAPMTELDEYYAAQAAGKGLTADGRPACLDGQFRGRDGRCKFVPVEGMNGLPAAPSATGVQWTRNGTTRMALSNGRVWTVPSLPGFMNGGSANNADLQDSRIQSWREGTAGAKWQKYSGYPQGDCGPDGLMTPSGNCVETSTMFPNGWTRSQYGNRQVAKPYQLSYADQTFNPYLNTAALNGPQQARFFAPGQGRVFAGP